ncbi:MAG: RIO1 family regulatory kinase/ATPase [Desulfobacteraceae bacterium]
MVNPMFESLKISDLPHRNLGVLRKPSSTRPTLWLVEENGMRAVVKDYSSNRFLYRNTIGRFLLWRERKAYRRLKGLRGVPTCYRVIDGLAIVIEEISGRNIEGLENEKGLSQEFFHQLQELVKNVHSRGLAHCDLKRAPNILLGHDERPYLVDWSASISKREFWLFPLNLIFQRFLQDDLNAITKMRLRHCPESVSPDEARRYFHRSRTEEMIRSVRDKLRNWLQRIA